jgi:hypothetical protein
MTKTFQDETFFVFSNFGHWTLFDICNLIFVILIMISRCSVFKWEISEPLNS